MQLFDSIFVIAIIMFSAVIHEVMHGVAADKLGDPTARYAGRLTLNPIAHLDPFGSVLLPVILALTNSPILFGWAKPVPYNPYNLVRAPQWGEAIVAAAGPASNFLIAITFAVFSQLLPVTSSFASQAWFALGTGHSVFALATSFYESLYVVSILFVLVNIMLGIFNLIPIPPLDGSKILSGILPRALSRGYDQFRTQLELNPFMGMGLVLLVILFLGGSFGRLIYSVAQALAGT